MKKTLSEDDQKLLLFSLLCIQIACPKFMNYCLKPDFLNWDNDLAFEDNKKKEEESKSLKMNLRML